MVMAKLDIKIKWWWRVFFYLVVVALLSLVYVKRLLGVQDVEGYELWLDWQLVFFFYAWGPQILIAVVVSEVVSKYRGKKAKGLG